MSSDEPAARKNGVLIFLNEIARHDLSIPC